MGTDTNIGMVALGGALAFVVVWFIQWLAPSAPVTPELSAAFTTIFTVVLAYLLPALDPQSRASRRAPSVHRDYERIE